MKPAQLITQNTIQQILGRLDILDVVGQYVRLKKRGSNYIGLCPFHNEKSPSFSVSPTKEIYKCFGCGKSGNTISFLMDHDKLSYVEALRWLANRYNVEVEETEVSAEQKQIQQTGESLHILNDFAQKYFTTELFTSEEGRAIGLAYLEDRGFNKAIIEKFQLGYANEHPDDFTQTALKAQHSQELLVRSGLSALRSERLVDNYRDRIIFPIHGTSGKIVGFGARQIRNNPKSPKYINTPENEIYIKSKILYGTYFARQPIDKFDECLLVEGYTDVISLHQAGVENVVASSGTSLTPDQLRLIKKYTNNLTIIYDGDSAGIKASLRGLELALTEGLNVKLVLIPDKEDPDSYVRKIGAKQFREFVTANKKDFILFQLEVLLGEAGDDTSKRSDAVRQIAESISKLDKSKDFTRQQDYIRKVSSLLKIDEAGLTSLVNQFIRDKISTGFNLPAEEAQPIAPLSPAEEKFDDQTFSLLFKDELQEKEIIRVLIVYGERQQAENRSIAEHVVTELPDDDLFDNTVVLKVLQAVREQLQQHSVPNRNFYIYNPDQDISSLAVSLLNFPYEESERWKANLSSSSGYQTSLFDQDYKSFLHTLKKDNQEQLYSYLNIGKDNSNEIIESAIAILKLRKIKRLLLENQADMEKGNQEQQMDLINTHFHLKQLEIELTRKLGTVILV